MCGECMEIIEKQQSKNLVEKPSKDATAMGYLSGQIKDLEIQKQIIVNKIKLYDDEPIHRPSKEHKKLNQELLDINKKNMKLTKTLKKFKSIKEITDKLGCSHGKVKLNSIKCHW